MTASAIFTPSMMWILLVRWRPASGSRGCNALWRGAGLRSKPSDPPRFRWPLPRTGPRRTQGRRSRASFSYTRRGSGGCRSLYALSAEAETLDQLAVAADVLLLQVLQEATPPA